MNQPEASPSNNADAGRGLSEGLGAGAGAPKPPAYCKQCAGSVFDWWGVSAFKCRGCGDVAHWLSPEQRQAIKATLEAPNDQHKGPPQAVPLDAPVGRVSGA